MKSVELVLERFNSDSCRLILPVPNDVYSNLRIDILRLEGYDDSKPDCYYFRDYELSFASVLDSYLSFIRYLESPSALDIFVSTNIFQPIHQLNGCKLIESNRADLQGIRFPNWKLVGFYIFSLKSLIFNRQ